MLKLLAPRACPAAGAHNYKQNDYPGMSFFNRRMVIMLLLTGLVFGGIFGWKAFVNVQIAKAIQGMEPPPATVSTATAEAARWTPDIPAVGTLRSLQGVDVTAQVAGLITELHFESGDRVAKGDLLIQQYIADDKARLDGLVAETRLAELNYSRSKELIAKQLISDFEFDARETDLERARAAEAALRLSIEQRSIRAPFAGKLGIRQVDIGQYIEPGDTLARLEALEQMRVTFPVPQRRISEVYTDQPLTITVDAWPGMAFTGRVTAIEPRVNDNTRTVSVQGLVDNPELKLTPGMFAQVRIALAEATDVITVPQSAIAFSPYGDAVYIVNDPDSDSATVTNTFVVTGATRGDQIEIVSGLAAGQVVVTAGQQKLRNGARVVINNAVPVSNQAAPDASNN